MSVVPPKLPQNSGLSARFKQISALNAGLRLTLLEILSGSGSEVLFTLSLAAGLSPVPRSL